jgi:hypothetical protein
MNLVGKIFTVLIFVMSILFMAFSIMVFATHTNWKARAGVLQTELTKLQGAKKEADDLLQRLQRDIDQERAARAATLAALQVRASRSGQDLVAKQQELDLLSAAHTTASKTAEAAQTRLATLEKEASDLRDALRTVQRDLDQKFLTVVDLTDKLNQAESVRKNLDEVNKQATFEMSKMKSVLNAHGLKADELVTHIPPPVEGVVLEAAGKDLIEISIGSDDGLKVGHSLDVYRDNQYLGRITIKRADPDRAVGQVKRELQRGQIKRGDRVTTKFS